MLVDRIITQIVERKSQFSECYGEEPTILYASEVILVELKIEKDLNPCDTLEEICGMILVQVNDPGHLAVGVPFNI